MHTAPHRLSACEAAEAIEAGELTVVELAKALLDRIDARPEVQAWAWLDKELVMSEARRLDAVPLDQRTSQFFGAIVCEKDIMYTKDMPTQFGCERFKNHFAPFDATIVAVLRANGCLIFGKTHTGELAIGAPTDGHPPTRNPHDIKRSPGNSSCGSAAAVADLQIPLALGTQTGGSVICPASFCGVYAYKPSQALVSLQGVSVVSPTLDTAGFFARDIADLQAMASLFGIGSSSALPDVRLRSPRIAVCKTAAWNDTTPEAKTAFSRALQCLSYAEIETKEIVLPEGFARARSEGDVIITKEFSVAFKGVIATGTDGLSADIVSKVEEGERMPWAKYQQSRTFFEGLKKQFNEIMSSGEYDALLTLSTSCSAPVDETARGDFAYTYAWTALRVPVVNLPGIGDVETHMPIGMQLIGAEFDDVRLLQVAERVSKALDKNGNWQSEL